MNWRSVLRRPEDTADPVHLLQPAPRQKADGLGVREQIDLLRKLAPALRDELKESTGKLGGLSVLENVSVRRLIKTAVALALAVALGWIPLQRLLSTTSSEATVNARVITLRAPIEGRISDWRSASGVGTALHAGDTMFRIENARADRSRLDEIRRQIATLTAQRITSDERTAQLEMQRTEQLDQLQNFKQHRIAHIEARRREIVADKDAAVARFEAAAATLQRTATLRDKGFQSHATYDQALREQKVAQATIVALDRRTEAADVELTAARQGTFVADGYNDVPRSGQRASELAQAIAELKVARADQDRRLAQLQSQLEEETRLFHTVSIAEMTSPANGQVWEILTSPGEDVHRGQELMRVLDCRGAVVTAAVSEATFNKLHLGGPATFRLRGESTELPGRITGLYGLASVPANLAIHQKMLDREPYHAAVEVPALAAGDSCQIGRTGIVTFGASAKP